MAHSEEYISKIESQWRNGKSFRVIKEEYGISTSTLTRWKKSWDEKDDRISEIDTKVATESIQKYVEKKSDDISSELIRVESEYRQIFEDLRSVLSRSITSAKGIVITGPQDLMFVSRGLKALLETASDLKAEEMAELEASTETQAVLFEQLVYIPGVEEPIDPNTFNNWLELEGLLKEQDPHNYYATTQDN